MLIKKFLMLAFSFFIFCGCGGKNLEYKKVYIPIKCQTQMPNKPKNRGDFASHKRFLIYLLECENRLKFCLGLKND